MTWIPEFIAIFVALLILFKAAGEKELRLPMKYTLLLIIYFVHIAFGFLLNDVTAWTMMAGVRIYAKFIPIFLLPIIFPFTDRAFKNIILWVFALSMLQLPVILWQRFIQFGGVLSGDPMGGTLGVSASGILAIYLVSILSFLIAFYFKEEISLPVFLFSSLAATIPLAFNQTKISFFLLPIPFIISAIFIKGKRETIFRAMLTMLILVFSFLVILTVYNDFAQKRWGFGMMGFISDRSLMQNTKEDRLDPIKYALTHAATKDVRFAFLGRGAGNASQGFTRQLEGKYLREARFYGSGMTFTKLIWEVGIMGTIIFFLFPLFFFVDAARLCRQDGVPGAFSLGMLSFTIIFTLSLFYTFTIDSNVLIYMFFLSAGQLVSFYAQNIKKSEESMAEYQK